MSINIKDIKLVIWDLDDTFWKGTLSEGPITCVDSNIKLVRDLTDCGIINSICSKNDAEPALFLLEKSGVKDLFVFPSINWSAKGDRIASMIKDMGLRPTNCLFIDDNTQNLREAEFFSPGLHTIVPDDIYSLIAQVQELERVDPLHKRLAHYKILESKREAAKTYSDNYEFLYSSNIQVELRRDCLNELDRIAELVARTNQLNFTKKRSDIEELKRIINDTSYDTGYVKVRDNFGDYGIVGFFAIKNHRCEHFLFSCRTIGQGVEEYVYAELNYPSLTIVEPVVNNLEGIQAPLWINQENNKSEQLNIPKNKNKIVFKGGCDLAVVREYLNTNNLIEEFTYVGKNRANNIEHRNHSVNYLQWRDLSQKKREELVASLIFNDEDMFETQMYDSDVSLVLISSMIEPHLGIYRDKRTGFIIAFGESAHPLTDKDSQRLYINKEIFTAANEFTQPWMEWFAQNYEFVGSLSPEEILENAKATLSKISPNAKLGFILGPELLCEGETQQEYKGREIIYAKINKLFREWAIQEPNVILFDTSKLITKQSDYAGTINHWQRHIYYKLAQQINEQVELWSDIEIKHKGIIYHMTRVMADKIGKTGLYQTKIWKKIRTFI